jgi:hypothetical protein
MFERAHGGAELILQQEQKKPSHFRLGFFFTITDKY